MTKSIKLPLDSQAIAIILSRLATLYRDLFTLSRLDSLSRSVRSRDSLFSLWKFTSRNLRPRTTILSYFKFKNLGG